MDQDYKNKGNNAPGALIIGKQQKKVLSKSQETFNRLIKRIEKLRKEIIEVNKSLNEQLEYYVKNIYPLKIQQHQLDIEIAKLLFGFFKNKKLTRKERAGLGGVIAGLLDRIFDFEEGEPADDLKEIFNEVQGVSYEEFLENDFELNKLEMESVFKEYGFDVDLDSLNSNMSREDMIHRMMEMEEEFRQKAESGKTGRKKSKKQLQKEEKERLTEEARSKNISSIYKQLAKIFHPDLEMDENLKAEKGELMKQLTIAYEKKDLHTLLKLELTWIQKEENITDKLTDEKLAVYNGLLNEQVLQLEQEMRETILHPRYQALHEFTLLPGYNKNVNLTKEKQVLERFTRERILSKERLKGNEQQALLEVKSLIMNFELDKHFLNH